jgi:hypothetical protein
VGDGVREVVDVDNVLGEFYVFWSLPWPKLTFESGSRCALVGLSGEGWVNPLHCRYAAG